MCCAILFPAGPEAVQRQPSEDMKDLEFPDVLEFIQGMCLTSLFRKVPLFPSLILMPLHHQEEKAKISAFNRIYSVLCAVQYYSLQGLRQCYVSLWKTWKLEFPEVLEFNQVRGAPEYPIAHNPSSYLTRCMFYTQIFHFSRVSRLWRPIWVPYPLPYPDPSLFTPLSTSSQDE